MITEPIEISSIEKGCGDSATLHVYGGNENE